MPAIPAKLIVVVPCFYEEACLPATLPALDAHLRMLKEQRLCTQGSFLLVHCGQVYIRDHR